MPSTCELMMPPPIPVVRRAAPTTLWTDEDPYGGRPAVAGSQVADAAALVEGARSVIEPV